MTVYVETDFLLALVKPNDWLQRRAETILAERDVVTSPTAYLELLLTTERDAFDHARVVGNLLELVPVGSATDHQIVLKTVSYFEDGMMPFDAFHAATTETRGHPICSSDKAYADADPTRIPLEPEEPSGV